MPASAPSTIGKAVWFRRAGRGADLLVLLAVVYVLFGLQAAARPAAAGEIPPAPRRRSLLLVPNIDPLLSCTLISRDGPSCQGVLAELELPELPDLTDSLL